MSAYQFRETIPDDVCSQLGESDQLVASLLWSRGVTTKDAAGAFLNPDFKERHDPFLMTDMERAVTRILSAINNGERIGIWSDYDCDGVPGGVLLHDFFSAIGYTNFENYIPHRHNEGFGLNMEGIEELHTRGVSLVITVDCGIANIDEVAFARERGVDVIVTDHHEPGATLPPAYAVLDPKRDHAYPFRELCGTGVAWKLVEALLMRGSFTLTPGQEKWWLDMVGLATLADMVPLVGENRVLAHFGLLVMKKARRHGLVSLLRALKIKPHDLTDDDIGFSIAPRVNAASRMGDPRVAFELFSSSDPEVSRTHAEHLEHINNERKGTVASMIKEIKKRMSLRELDEVIVIGDPSWRPSLAGLAANTLAEEHGRPAFVWGRDGKGVIKGSARSNGSASVVALMEHAADVFIEYGGHHASGGFSVHETSIHTLADRLVESFRTHAHTPTEPRIPRVDMALSLEEVTPSLHRTIMRLSPFGVGNDKPLFVFRGATPEVVTTFGKGNEHTRATFRHKNGTLTAIAFFKLPDSFTRSLSSGAPVDLLAHVERSTFAGRSELRLRIVDCV